MPLRIVLCYSFLYYFACLWNSVNKIHLPIVKFDIILVETLQHINKKKTFLQKYKKLNKKFIFYIVQLKFYNTFYNFFCFVFYCGFIKLY